MSLNESKKQLEASKNLQNHIGRFLAQKAKDDKEGKEISTPKLDRFQMANLDLS
jgi:hypothetical protein